MKTTAELSDELVDRAKAQAALRGVEFKDLVEQGLRRVLDEPEPPAPQSSLFELMGDCCGIVASGSDDPGTASLPAPTVDQDLTTPEGRVKAAGAWLAAMQEIGRQICDKPVDPRSLVEILNEDRNR